MKDQLIKLVVLVGPTGIGKTDMGIQIARKLKTEIISCDSMQIYRSMDIGTSKPTTEQESLITHHLINIIDPDEKYDAAQYYQQAGRLINKFIKENKIPLIVGGTGFYLKALLYGLFEHPEIPDKFRKSVIQKYQDLDNPGLHHQLTEIDPQSADRIHPNDRKRILRAIEIFEYTGITMTELQNRKPLTDSIYDPLIIGLKSPMKELYEKINLRVLGMIKNGWVEEVRKLREMGYPPELQSMQALGYNQINAYLDGKKKWDEIIPIIQQDTRNYAKRQMTWFRADKNIQWIDISGKSHEDIVTDCLTRIGKHYLKSKTHLPIGII